MFICSMKTDPKTFERLEFSLKKPVSNRSKSNNDAAVETAAQCFSVSNSNSIQTTDW